MVACCINELSTKAAALRLLEVYTSFIIAGVVASALHRANSAVRFCGGVTAYG